jgi:glycosyltransferase involved in cell wall biosynthesis
LSGIALLIVGPGISAENLAKIKKKNNIHYLGPVYDEDKMSEIFYMSDVFCIPGAIGLGFVEAFYWGKPVITMDVTHGPEVFYLNNGSNGYIVNTEDQLQEKIIRVLGDKFLYAQLSSSARQTFIQNASLEKMFQGFYDVLSSLD